MEYNHEECSGRMLGVVLISSVAMVAGFIAGICFGYALAIS
jgi:hypothetical protein